MSARLSNEQRMLAPLARFIDWLSIQMWFTRMPHADERSQRLEEALQFLKGPDFIPAESQPAQVEFRGPVHFRFHAAAVRVRGEQRCSRPTLPLRRALAGTADDCSAAWPE